VYVCAHSVVLSRLQHAMSTPQTMPVSSTRTRSLSFVDCASCAGDERCT
jgi:hypothetical protein